MNKDLLQKHIKNYQEENETNPEQFQEDWSEREEHVRKYQSYDREKLLAMDEEDLYEYISPLWAMLIWGVTGLRDKLKLWDYQEVLNVHENLEFVNESINQLDLVPGGF